MAINGFRCHGQQPRDILETISNAASDVQSIARFDSVVFGGHVRREMVVEGQPLTYVVLTLRRRILKEKLSFQISRRKDAASVPSSPPSQSRASPPPTPSLQLHDPSSLKPTLPFIQATSPSNSSAERHHADQAAPATQPAAPATQPAFLSPSVKPSAVILPISLSSSGSLGFVAARLAEDVCGALFVEGNFRLVAQIN